MTRLVPLWVGARGVEFDWKYIQMSFDANVSLVSNQFASAQDKNFFRLTSFILACYLMSMLGYFNV